MLRLCTICARGGSKGVPGKNVRSLNGQPLISYTLLQAQTSKLFDKIVVSSDSEEILTVATKYKPDMLIKRPAEMSNDAASKHLAIHHALSETEKAINNKFNTIVDLDVTSPLRTVSDMKIAIDFLERENIGSVLSAGKARHSPYFNIVEKDQNGKIVVSKQAQSKIVARQASPDCYSLNGSIYAFNRKYYIDDPKSIFPDTKLLIMPEFRAHDIDSEVDFRIVEMIMKEKLSEEGESYIV